MDRLSSNGQMLSQIDLSNVPHSGFDRTNHNFLSCKLGKIVCTRLDEVYPGDRIKGHIQTVANFEPLVAPIMGSMVMKQESFYVPYSIIWKNAHKFFTAKGGFNTPVPRVAPSDIYGAFVDNRKIPFELDDFTSGVVDVFYDEYETKSAFIEAYMDVLTDLLYLPINNLRTFLATYDAIDLVNPIYDHYNRIMVDESVNITQSIKDTVIHSIVTKIADELFDLLPLSSGSGSVALIQSENVKELVNIIADYYTTYFEFIFGVSSHLDYLGYPVIDSIYDFFHKDFQPETEGGKYSLSLWRQVVNYASHGSLDDKVLEFKDILSNISLSWLPFRAAYVIWYWNYRDELLELNALDPESDSFLADSPSAAEIVLLSILRVRCWYKDTFTTALTNTGSANLSVPAYPEFSNLEYTYYNDSGSALSNTTDFESALQAGASYVSITTAGNLTYKIPMNYFSKSFAVTGSSIESNFNSALSLDLFDRIHRLRTFLQKRLILGYEYDDMVWSSFMVKLSNVRMRIPELLSRGRDAVQINTLVNNTSTSEQDAGDKTAVAWAQGRTSDINYFAEEHGLFLSFMTILPVQSYTGGMQRLWMKHEQFDFMWPEFATMGMDAIYNFELSAPRPYISEFGLSDEASMQVFGYQGRYYDLKSKMDECHGRMRTDLHYMTFSREFNMKDKPLLNYVFVHCWPRLDMFVTDDPNVDIVKCVDVYNGLDFERRLPVPSEIL